MLLFLLWYNSVAATAKGGGVMFSGCLFFCPTLINRISQGCLGGICSYFTLLFTLTQGWTDLSSWVPTLMLRWLFTFSALLGWIHPGVRLNLLLVLQPHLNQSGPCCQWTLQPLWCKENDHRDVMIVVIPSFKTSTSDSSFLFPHMSVTSWQWFSCMILFLCGSCIRTQAKNTQVHKLHNPATGFFRMKTLNCCQQAYSDLAFTHTPVHLSFSLSSRIWRDPSGCGSSGGWSK